MSVQVDTDNRQQTHAVQADELSALLANALADQRSDGGDQRAEVGLSFIDAQEMTLLNAEHMGGSGPTDVLAFPIDGVEPADVVPDGQPAMLGDIVICPAVAAQAPQSLDEELALLVVHGALHLLGHDHVEPGETAVMKALEVELLQRFHHGRTAS